MPHYFLVALSWRGLTEFWSSDAIFPWSSRVVWQELFLGMAPRIQCLDPQNLWSICGIVLRYMAQVTLKRGYPGRSHLITRALKRRELSAGGCRREIQKHFKHEEELTCFCLKMEGATWERVWAASKSEQQSLADSQQGDRDLHPAPARKRSLPTPERACE